MLTCAAGAASCIDRYVELRKAEAEGKEDVVVDERLTAIVERLFSRCGLPSTVQRSCADPAVACVGRLHPLCALPCRCFADGQFEQAVGIALETRRLDKLEEAVHRSPDTVGILTYALHVCQDLVVSREFRFEARCSCAREALHASAQQRKLKLCLLTASRACDKRLLARKTEASRSIQLVLAGNRRAVGLAPGALHILGRPGTALCPCCLEVSSCVHCQVLRLLIKLYESVDNPDWASICQCLMFLDDAAEVAKILARLLKGSQVRLPASVDTEDCVAALLGECKVLQVVQTFAGRVQRS